MIPYIDSHNHLHALPWDAWELLGMCGMRAAVISAGTPYLSRSHRTEVPGPAEITELWRQPIQLAHAAPRELLFRLYVSVGISHVTRVRDWERLLDRMPVYFQDPRVVAVGEMGLDPFQVWGMTWSLEEQEEVLQAQLQVAKVHGKPFILHTPSPRKRALVEGGTPLPEDLKRSCLERDLRVVERIGIRRAAFENANTFYGLRLTFPSIADES